MPKKIVLCFDGTSNQPSDAVQGRARSGGIEDDGITNVLKLYLLLGGKLTDQEVAGDQISFYHSGVGTYGSKYRQIYNSAFSPARLDVGRIIRSGIEDLKRAYSAGDEVFLFGFSRGAAIARRFASVLPEFFENPIPEVRFIGVWDTVASIGVPNLDDDEKPISDVFFEQGGTISSHIVEALHLVAIDERRKAFMPTLMNKDPRVMEVWFPGVHSDNGGGFRHDGLSDITLQFMLDEIERRSLGLKIMEPMQVPLDDILPPDEDYEIDLDDLRIEPNPFGKAHIQKRPWLTTRITLATRDVRVNANDESTGDHPTIHWSAAERIYGDPDYRPKALSGRPHELLHPGGRRERFKDLRTHLERGVRNLAQLAPGESKECICRAHLKHNHTGIALEEGAEYVFKVPDGQKWHDASIECGPEGWKRSDVELGPKELLIKIAESRRRKRDANWFALVGSVAPADEEMFELLEHRSSPYVPGSSGELCTFANDLHSKYGNNSGRMKFEVKRLS